MNRDQKITKRKTGKLHNAICSFFFYKTYIIEQRGENMSIESLWSSRFQQHMQNIITYFARMINGLLYSFIFISCVGAYYYAQFLKASPSKGISLLLITIVLTFIITRCPIRTFIQKPDAVYLLALEEKLTSYFKNLFYTITSFSFSHCYLRFLFSFRLHCNHYN